MKYKTNKILYLKSRIYYFIMLMIIIPLNHSSLKSDTQLLIIIDIIIFIGFILDFIYRNYELEIHNDSFEIWRNIGSIKILRKQIRYDSLTYISVNSNRYIGKNIFMRYKEIPNIYVFPHELQISFNYLYETDVAEIIKTFLDRAYTRIRINDKILSQSEIIEYKNNLSSAI